MVEYEVYDKGEGTVIVSWDIGGGKKKSLELSVGLPGEVVVRGAPDASLIRQRRRIREKTWKLLAQLYSQKEVRVAGLEESLDKALVEAGTSASRPGGGPAGRQSV